ncbi:ankyrin repeat-containing protein itn1 [Quercus suber]|uniref:Ankyrin repeat-containing protein itn1 n=1 Tax=Quercus suber TaxID=58331 RepID=A0AAW0L0S3_QUESU
MVAAENSKLETPLHEACRQGNVKVLPLLLDASPWADCKLNSDNQSTFYMACSHGHLNVVNLLSGKPWVQGLEQDSFVKIAFMLLFQEDIQINMVTPSTILQSLEVTISYQNHKGSTALDIFDQASGNVHIKLIQQQVEKICEIQDNNTSEPECSSKQTNNSLTSTLTSLGQQKRLSERRQGELAELYRSRQSKQDEIYSEAVQNARNTITLVAILIATVTFAAGISPPGGIYQDGPLKGKSMVCKTIAFKEFTLSNNIALSTSLCIVVVLVSIIPFQRKPQMIILKVLTRSCGWQCHSWQQLMLQQHGSSFPMIVEFLINKKTVEINSQNYGGLTALGIQDQAGSIDEFPHIKAMLERAGGIDMKILRSKEVEGTNPGVFEDTWRPIKLDNVSRLTITKDFGDPPNQGNYEVNALHHQVEETDKIQEDNSTMPDHSPKKTTSSLANLQRHKLLSRRRKVELTKLYNDRRSRQHDIYREALQNARNTITLVAILIATVTFTAGLNPPGGVYQQQSWSGNSTVAGTNSFQCLYNKQQHCIVHIFEHCYNSTTWIILPHGRGKEWILAISAATMGTLFFYLRVVLARHWLRKLKWRKDKGKKQGTVVLTDSKNQSQSAMPDIKLDIKFHSTNFNTRDETRSESKSNFSTNSDLSSSRCLG